MCHPLRSESDRIGLVVNLFGVSFPLAVHFRPNFCTFNDAAHRAKGQHGFPDPFCLALAMNRALSGRHRTLECNCAWFSQCLLSCSACCLHFANMYSTALVDKMCRRLANMTCPVF